MARVNGSSGNDKLSGSATVSDQIYGLAGNDTLTGSGSVSDMLYGGAGNDTFNIVSGTHTVADFSKVGTNGSDTLNVSAGATAIVTGVLDVSGNAVTNYGTIVITGTNGKDNMVGSAGNDSISGGSGNDTLNGSDGADTLSGGAGNDSMTGGIGNDTFKVDSGTDTVTDLTNGDVLIVSSGATAKVTVSDDFTATKETSNKGKANLTLADGKDAYLALANVTGTIGYTISAKDNNNASTIEGSAGADIITGSKRDDTLEGNAGNDSLNGGDGADTLSGGAGNDSMTGGNGNDTFNVDSGTDTITDFGTGTDVLVVSASAIASVTVVADYTATGADNSNHGTANLKLTSAADNVNLNAVTVGNGVFNITASNTKSNIVGSGIKDSITGGTGNDTLDGGAGNDTLIGGAGDDTLTVASDASDADNLTGGAGNDTFTVSAGSATITDLGNGADILQISSTGAVNAAVTANFIATSATSNTGTVTLTQGAKVGIINMAAAVGDHGYTIVKDSTGVSLKATGSGFGDQFQFADKKGLLATTVSGGEGHDMLTFKNSVTLTLVDTDFSKVSGVEELQLSNSGSSVTIGNFAAAAGIATVTGGNGDDTINASSAPTAMTLVGGAGKDTITGGADADNLTGGDDADNLTGGAGADNLTGGAGADNLTGGAGADDMTGGTGADTFVFAAGDSGTISGTVFDIVRDYTAGVGGDTLNLVGSAAAQANAADTDVKGAIVSGTGSETVTAAIASGVITLSGGNAGAIDSLAEWLAVARLMVTTDTKVGAFVFGGDTYVYQENSGGDLLIQLDNVTGITAVGVAAAATTILVA